MRFITLEGVDGAGKSSHIEFIADAVRTKGMHVIVTDATAAYQGAGNGVSRELIERLAEAAHPGLKPNRTLIFDCPYEVARERLAKTGRALDRFEREDRAFFERVRNTYLAIAKAEPDRVRVIDASGEHAAVRDQIKTALEGL